MGIHVRTTGCRLPYATRHKRTHPALTPAGEGWSRGRGIEPGTAGSEVWGTPPKFVPTLSRLPCYTSHGKAVKFPRIIATSPTVIDTFVMDFKIIFEYSRLKIFGDPLPSLGYALDSLGQPLVCVRIWGASTLKCRNLVSWKSPLRWVNMSAYTLFC